MFKYIAVDFDGTLCTHAFPDIGKPKERVIEYVQSCSAAGAKIILYTCRGGEHLAAAVEWCAAQNIPIDAVNENPWVTFGDKKVYADIYIDDRAVSVSEIDRAIGLCAGRAAVPAVSSSQKKAKKDKDCENEVLDVFRGYCKDDSFLLAAFMDFLEMRKKKGKKVDSKRTAEMLCCRLDELAKSPEQRADLVDYATAQKWLSFYPLPASSAGNKKAMSKNTKKSRGGGDWDIIKKQLSEIGAEFED